jgi:hypothetical protein
VVVKKESCVPTKKQYTGASQQNMLLPTISPFYGANESLSAIMETL